MSIATETFEEGGGRLIEEGYEVTSMLMSKNGVRVWAAATVGAHRIQYLVEIMKSDEEPVRFNDATEAFKYADSIRGR